LATLFEPPPAAVPDGIATVMGILRAAGAVVGPHDEVLQANDAAIELGIVRGTRVVQTQVLAMVRRARDGQLLESANLELKRRRAGALFLNVRAAPLTSGLVLILCEDRTQMVRLEEIRRDFVVNVSHELKTPIGAISLLAEAVDQAADEPSEVRRFSARMLVEANRLSALARQVIELSRLQSDEPLAAATAVEVDEVLLSAIDRCRVDAERRQVELTLAGVSDMTVSGDVAQLETAVGNLVENAVTYSDQGARVVVAANPVTEGSGAERRSWVEITVTDNGIGIAPADLDRIFERFYRVDFARSRANGGTGLGLAIVKHVAAIHGGTIEVWSQLGQGSTFTLRIPAFTEEEA